MTTEHTSLTTEEQAERMMSQGNIALNERELVELNELVSSDLNYAFACLDTPSKETQIRDSIAHMKKVVERLKTFVNERKLSDCQLSEYITTASKLLNSKHRNPFDEYLDAKYAYKTIIRILGRLSR